ncbi:MAG: hypothetical protein ACLURV_00255 [Gallintestinimicrobium sp.]
MINILILSAGTRDKVVQYFKEVLAGKGKVIATDCSPYAPAIYEADEYVLVPRITEPGYLDKILEICREKQITGVLSLIDPELSLLADNKERFLEVGTVPIVPDAKQVDICFHKYAMYEACKALGFATGRCFLDRKEFYHAVENGELTHPALSSRKAEARVWTFIWLRIRRQWNFLRPEDGRDSGVHERTGIGADVTSICSAAKWFLFSLRKS